MLEQAKKYALEYRHEIVDRTVFPSSAALRGLDIFDEPLPSDPADPRRVLELLHQVGSPATVAHTGGRYFGFVVGGILPAALAAKWLADTWDQNAGMFVGSPIASSLESVCERWLRELLGLPESTVAGFVSGTSIATLCGVAAGRNELLRRLGWDVQAKGLFGAPEIRVVLGAQAHSTVFKALSILGLGQEQVTSVPVDDQGRMVPDRAGELDNRTLLILQAGNVNSGAFDPFTPLCTAARERGGWVHIDGAFGLWAAASRKRSHLTEGIALADSWSADAHKTLNAPYDNGIIFCRDRTALIRAMQMAGSYIVFSEQRDGMIYTPEMSRRGRGMELWATLKALGRNGVADLVDSLCDRAVEFAEGLRKEGFLIRNEVCFNQVLVSCSTPKETQATLAIIQKTGECWCGGATWNNEPVIRISVCSFMTSAADIERSVRAFVQARDKARGLGALIAGSRLE